MRPLNFTDYKSDQKSTIWFELEPGDSTRYIFGVCHPACFIGGCSHAEYIQIMTENAMYQFMLLDIMAATEDSYYGYFATKLKTDEYTVSVIILFLKNYFHKNGVSI
jgi:hypothetical protein